VASGLKEGAVGTVGGYHRENRATGKIGETNHRHHKHSHHEKKKWLHACRLFRMNSLKEGTMQHVDPLLGNDLETNNETTFVARQQILNRQEYRVTPCQTNTFP
jgi:hypothetical protein